MLKWCELIRDADVLLQKRLIGEINTCGTGYKYIPYLYPQREKRFKMCQCYRVVICHRLLKKFVLESSITKLLKTSGQNFYALPPVDYFRSLFRAKL